MGRGKGRKREKEHNRKRESGGEETERVERE